jgi:excisionase family DNA binding protein
MSADPSVGRSGGLCQKPGIELSPNIELSHRNGLSNEFGHSETPPSSPNQPAPPRVPRLAYSPTEAAQALGVSRSFFFEHVNNELRWIRRGRRKLVSIAELQKWLERSSAR